MVVSVVSVKCRNCKKTFTFETERKPWFEKHVADLLKEGPEVFVKKCPYCGILNEVKVPVKVK